MLPSGRHNNLDPHQYLQLGLHRVYHNPTPYFGATEFPQDIPVAPLKVLS